MASRNPQYLQIAAKIALQRCVNHKRQKDRHDHNARLAHLPPPLQAVDDRHLGEKGRVFGPDPDSEDEKKNRHQRYAENLHEKILPDLRLNQ